MLEAKRPVAVLMTNAHGDHLLNLPAVRALATLFCGRLSLVCTGGMRERFFSVLPLRDAPEIEMQNAREVSKADEPFFTKTYDFTGRVIYTRTLDIESLVQRIGECDLLLSLDTSPLPALGQILRHLSPANSIGFHPSYNVSLPLDYDRHAFELAFELPRHLNPSLRLEDFAAPPVFSSASRQQARRIREALPAKFKVLAVHADTKPEKMWATEKFIKLLDMFLERQRNYVALVVGTQNLGLDKGRFGERVFPCYGLSVTAAMALVSEADLFVGVDSCMLHVADLFGVPGVGLFGPTNPRQWGFRFGLHRHIGGAAAMDAIREGDVLVALEEVLVEASETSTGREAKSGDNVRRHG